MLRAQNRVLRCAQPTSRRLMHKTAILTQMLRPRNSAMANECPGMDHRFFIGLRAHSFTFSATVVVADKSNQVLISPSIPAINAGLAINMIGP